MTCDHLVSIYGHRDGWMLPGHDTGHHGARVRPGVRSWSVVVDCNEPVDSESALDDAVALPGSTFTLREARAPSALPAPDRCKALLRVLKRESRKARISADQRKPPRLPALVHGLPSAGKACNGCRKLVGRFSASSSMRSAGHERRLLSHRSQRRRRAAGSGPRGPGGDGLHRHPPPAVANAVFDALTLVRGPPRRHAAQPPRSSAVRWG